MSSASPEYVRSSCVYVRYGIHMSHMCPNMSHMCPNMSCVYVRYGIHTRTGIMREKKRETETRARTHTNTHTHTHTHTHTNRGAYRERRINKAYLKACLWRPDPEGTRLCA
jgi:hypothetical protein